MRQLTILALIITLLVTTPFIAIFTWIWVSVNIHAWLGLPAMYLLIILIVAAVSRAVEHKQQIADPSELESWKPFDIQSYIEELENRKYA